MRRQASWQDLAGWLASSNFTYSTVNSTVNSRHFNRILVNGRPQTLNHSRNSYKTAWSRPVIFHVASIKNLLNNVALTLELTAELTVELTVEYVKS